MKKTLVALAVVAASGASFAQNATISGALSFSYQNDLLSNKGMAVTDNSLTLTVVEDLGGGVTLTGKSEFVDGGGRNTTGAAGVGAGDLSLTVSGGFGAVKVASYESDGPFANVAISGASLPLGVFDANGANMGKRFRNAITYVAPAVNGFTGALTYVTAAGQFNNTPIDPSKPTGALFDNNTKIVPALTYVSGPLKAYVEYAMFNGAYSNSSADTITQPTAYVSYDFGVAKVAAGWTKPSNNDTTVGFGLNAPVGPLTIGFETFSFNSSAAAGTATYSDFAIAYNLSKRTSLKASFGTINDAFASYSKDNFYGQSVLAGKAYSTSQSRFGLFHSF